jgi:hypothetical protein
MLTFAVDTFAMVLIPIFAFFLEQQGLLGDRDWDWDWEDYPLRPQHPFLETPRNRLRLDNQSGVRLLHPQRLQTHPSRLLLVGGSVPQQHQRFLVQPQPHTRVLGVRRKTTRRRADDDHRISVF